MLAADTNILVRLMTWDDAVQSPLAKQLFATEHVFIGTSVILETEWVLRRTYRFPTAQRSSALRSLIGLPGVSVDRPATIAAALDLMDGGMDLADALHLQAAAGCDAMISFDRDFARAAARLGTLPVRAP